MKFSKRMANITSATIDAGIAAILFNLSKAEKYTLTQKLLKNNKMIYGEGLGGRIK